MIKLLTLAVLSFVDLSGATTPSMTTSHIAALNREKVKSGGRCVTKHPTEQEAADLEIEEEKKYTKIIAGMSAAQVRDFERDGGFVTAQGIVGKRVVDVHYHVISMEDGTGDVSTDDIKEQHRVLRRTFGKHGFKFVNKGITRTVNDVWHYAAAHESEEISFKKALRVGDASTLNVYINYGGGSGILGHATFPNWYAIWPEEDGVVVSYSTLPRGSLAPYNLGDTLIHEVGHWLGLYHTFQGGCNEGWYKGDRVRDTPAVRAPNFQCNVGVDSCPGEKKALGGDDLVRNFMDYTDDACSDSFTLGQRRRMKKLWSVYRDPTLN